MGIWWYNSIKKDNIHETKKILKRKLHWKAASLFVRTCFRVCWGRWKMMMTIMMRTCNRWRVLVLTQTIFSLLFCRKTNSGSGLKTCHVILDPTTSSEILRPDVSPCECNCIFASLRCQGAHVHVLVCAFYSQICWNLLWKKKEWTDQ